MRSLKESHVNSGHFRCLVTLVYNNWGLVLFKNPAVNHGLLPEKIGVTMEKSLRSRYKSLMNFCETGNFCGFIMVYHLKISTL